MRQISSLCPERMKIAGQIIEIKRDAVWLMSDRGRFYGTWIQRQTPQQPQFGSVLEALQRRVGQEGGPRRRALRKFGENFARVAEDRMPPRVAVLNIEYRIVL